MRDKKAQDSRHAAATSVATSQVQSTQVVVSTAPVYRVPAPVRQTFTNNVAAVAREAQPVDVHQQLQGAVANSANF